MAPLKLIHRAGWALAESWTQRALFRDRGELFRLGRSVYLQHRSTLACAQLSNRLGLHKLLGVGHVPAWYRTHEDRQPGARQSLICSASSCAATTAVGGSMGVGRRPCDGSRTPRAMTYCENSAARSPAPGVPLFVLLKTAAP